MANQDRRPPPQPAEDMFGRPTDVRAEQETAEREREDSAHKQYDEFHKHCEHDAQEEIAYGGVGELPDGDGVRSDLGTNPLPEVYWSAYPDKRPDKG